MQSNVSNRQYSDVFPGPITAFEPGIFVDTLHHRVLVETADGMRTIGKEGTGPGEFRYPMAVVVAFGRAYILDCWNHRVQAFTLPQWTFEFAFDGMFCPRAMELIERHGAWLLSVTDTNNARVAFYQADGTPAGSLDMPSHRFPVRSWWRNAHSLAVTFEDGTEQLLSSQTQTAARQALVEQWLAAQTAGFDEKERCERENAIIRRLDAVDRTLEQLQSPAPRPQPTSWPVAFQQPFCMVRDAAGNICVSDFGSRRVERFSADGKLISSVAPGVFQTPGRMTTMGADLIIPDPGLRTVVRYDTAADTWCRWDSGVAVPAVAAADSGRLWLASREDASQLHVFDAKYCKVGPLQLSGVGHIADIEVRHDALFIADDVECTVWRFDLFGNPTGRIGPEHFLAPVWSVSVDAVGNLVVGSRRKIHCFDKDLRPVAELWRNEATSGSIADTYCDDASGRLFYVDWEGKAVRWRPWPIPSPVDSGCEGLPDQNE